MANVIPQWKQALIDRKQKKHEDERRLRLEEENRFHSMPQWKQAILAKRREHGTGGSFTVTPKRKDPTSSSSTTTTTTTAISTNTPTTDSYNNNNNNNAHYNASVQLSGVDPTANNNITKISPTDRLVDNTSLLGSIKSNPWIVKEKIPLTNNDVIVVGDDRAPSDGAVWNSAGGTGGFEGAKQRPEVIIIPRETMEAYKYVVPIGLKQREIDPSSPPQDETDQNISVQNMRSKFEAGRPHMRFSASFESSLAAKNASRSENRDKRLSLDVLAAMTGESGVVDTPPYAVHGKTKQDNITVDETPNLRPRSLSNSTSPPDKITTKRQQQNDIKPTAAAVSVSSGPVETKPQASSRGSKQKPTLPVIGPPSTGSKSTRSVAPSEEPARPVAAPRSTGKEHSSPADVDLPTTALLPSFLKGTAGGTARLLVRAEPEGGRVRQQAPPSSKVVKTPEVIPVPDSRAVESDVGGKPKSKDSSTKNGILMKPTLARPKAAPSTAGAVGQTPSGAKTTATTSEPAPKITTPQNNATPLSKAVAEIKADGRTFIVVPKSAKNQSNDKDDRSYSPEVSHNQFSFSQNGPSGTSRTIDTGEAGVNGTPGVVPPLAIPSEDDSEEIPITNIDDIDFNDDDQVPPTNSTSIKIVTTTSAPATQETTGKHKKSSNIIVIGGNAPTKKSCILKSNKRKKGLSIGFVEDDPLIYEYPSEACWSDEYEPMIKLKPVVTTVMAPAAPLAEPELDDIDPPVYNTTISHKIGVNSSNHLSSYTSQMEDAYKEEIERRKTVKTKDDEFVSNELPDNDAISPTEEIDRFSSSGSALLF